MIRGGGGVPGPHIPDAYTPFTHSHSSQNVLWIHNAMECPNSTVLSWELHCVCVLWTFMCTHMWRPENKFVCHSLSSIYLRGLRRVLSVAWNRLECLTSEPQEIASVHIPSKVLPVQENTCIFLCGSWEQNSGHYACVASSLPQFLISLMCT